MHPLSIPVKWIRWQRFLEFTALFIGLPLTLLTWQDHINPVPVLLLFSASATLYLIFKANFRSRQFGRIQDLKTYCTYIFRLFIPLAGLLSSSVYLFKPELFLYCPREQTVIWLTIMLSYPLLSVYPQEIIYRGFLLERYRILFPTQTQQLHASALAFSFGHIIYGNAMALILTLIGGYLFGATYLRTKSLLLASLEHALYGCLIFTIGLGRFLFSGFEALL
jgi:membrane protease YdiL (CAAX protease family)